MTNRTLLKIILFNVILSLINIILFSNAFLHIDISGKNALSTAFGVMIIVVSILLFFYVNYNLLLKKPNQSALPIPDKDIHAIHTLNECVIAIEDYMNNNVETYRENLSTVLSQINRMHKKKKTIHSTLLERFSETELSYAKFSSAVDGIEGIMLLNIKSLLNRIYAFDEEEYEDLIRGSKGQGEFSAGRADKLMESRLGIYQEYMSFVKKAVENNEEMLIRLDKLLLEMSKLSDIDQEDIEDIAAMKEIDELIHDTKWYR